jgi:molecular chaperone HscB
VEARPLLLDLDARPAQSGDPGHNVMLDVQGAAQGPSSAGRRPRRGPHQRVRREAPGMNLTADDFELFGLPRRFELDPASLDARWRALQTEVHPDRFVSEGGAARRIALQWAVRVNEAYQRLKDPLQRAGCLCELAGQRIDAEHNTAMPAEFLMQQMEWRDALADARTAGQVHGLAADVATQRRTALQGLQRLIDIDQDWPNAAAQVRALMFIERFGADIDHRLEALGE